MTRDAIFAAAVILIAVTPAHPQQARNESVPLYRVTVIERQINAVNYQYRSAPTKVDFRGTILMPDADGEAAVEARNGRTEIRAEFDDLLPPGRFGAEYLTYVLWAITPEGAPHNLGEVMPDGSHDAELHVTSGLQAFGMMVTAEPYAAVRQPSDVVVLENVVRPDTVGQVQPIRAKYELLPRGHYVFNMPAQGAANSGGPKVSMREYEAISHVYQAQNAVSIARTAEAAEHAPNTLAEAERMLAEARRLQSMKADPSLIVQSARAAAQTAEDARLIAERRAQEQKMADAQRTASRAEQARVQAEIEAQRARAEADAARAQAAAERAARERAEATAAAQSRAAAATAQSADRVEAAPEPQPASDPQKSRVRMRLLESLNGVMGTRDTPRGLVVSIPDAAFQGTALRAADAGRLARVAAIVAANPELRVEIEGHTDTAATESLAAGRAQEVRSALVRAGVPPAAISASNLGASHPLHANSSASGRIANRRVAVVISGEAIGNVPFWDRTYNLSTAR